MKEVTFHLEVFDGPLDLLLHLLSKNKVEIKDIPIASILDQYLEYIRQMKEFDLEVASEFITMAAQLMYIKSKMLLPQEEPEDTEEMLRQILQNTPSDYDPEAMLDVIEQEVRAARIILFTPKLDDRLIALLPQLSNRRALTVFYVISGGESEELPAGAEGYDCVPVRILSEALEDDSQPDREGEDEC